MGVNVTDEKLCRLSNLTSVKWYCGSEMLT